MKALKGVAKETTNPEVAEALRKVSDRIGSIKGSLAAADRKRMEEE